MKILKYAFGFAIFICVFGGFTGNKELASFGVMSVVVLLTYMGVYYLLFGFIKGDDDA